jgi:ABC-type branched-subunit amino acid transport system substrate-binding protein
MKKTPERWDVMGYDAYRIVSDVVHAGARSGREIAEQLNQLSDYQGIKGKISFKGNRRVNSEVNFLQFIGGKVVKHQVERQNDG